VAIIQTVMTYCILVFRKSWQTFAPYAPQTRIVWAVSMPALCPQHAHSLEPTLVIDRRIWSRSGSCCSSPPAARATSVEAYATCASAC